MGNNLYETPRDKNKWHTQGHKSNKTTLVNNDNKKERLEALKNRLKKQK